MEWILEICVVIYKKWVDLDQRKEPKNFMNHALVNPSKDKSRRKSFQGGLGIDRIILEWFLERLWLREKWMD